MNKKILGLLVGGLVLVVPAASAQAAKVTVEVEGLSLTVPPTGVDTPPTVSKGSDSCSPGDNVLGALDALTKGDWGGSIYAATRILSEDHPFAPNTPGWVFVINGKATSDYGCGAKLRDGDKLLWYASHGTPSHKAASGYDDPVLLDAPATAVPGQAFTVTVTDTTTSYDSQDMPTGTAFAPSPGATISGGDAAAGTDAAGHATVTVAGGPYTLVASKGTRAPARITGCATTGDDGFCGTPAKTVATPAPCLTKGDDGFCGTPDKRAALGVLSGITEGRQYKKGQGPRQLAGRVEPDGSGLADVQVRVTRNDRGRCATYDGKREAFVALTRCGATRGRWFSVGAKEQWSYLLPARLTRGRYVLDVRTTDKAGNRDAQLARGRNRVVFTVA